MNTKERIRSMFNSIRQSPQGSTDSQSFVISGESGLQSILRRMLQREFTRTEGRLAREASLVLRANALMTAWEYGDEARYHSMVAPNVRMSIAAYGIDAHGFDAIWGIRKSMKAMDAGPLDIHTVDTHQVRGRTLTALSHVISRSTAAFTQHAAVEFDFDDHDRLTHYRQDVIWSA
jgi:hypothetical protein